MRKDIAASEAGKDAGEQPPPPRLSLPPPPATPNSYFYIPLAACFLRLKNINPSPIAAIIIANPTPQVNPIPVISHMGVSPVNTSFQDINAEYTPWVSPALDWESGSTARTRASPVEVLPVAAPKDMHAFSNHSSRQKRYAR